jgi:GNAT superfamily N-acetyltransferase
MNRESDLLDNIVWHSLAGAHVRFALGVDDARRYAHGFSPALGFADPERPNFSALKSFCELGEQFYTDAWAGSPPTGWQIVMESTMFKMVWDGDDPPPDNAPDAVRLGAQHAQQAVELAELTRPGPFGLRTIELGEYFGAFDGDRLVAMAGERFQAGCLREISGVCTHPEYQGRGLARRLMTRLMSRELQRGETPVLHVMRENARAHALYKSLGFRDYRESVVRVVALCKPERHYERERSDAGEG